jgi:hypothetical protein
VSPGRPVGAAVNGEAQTIPFELTIDGVRPSATAAVYLLELTDADRGHGAHSGPEVDKRTDCGFKFTPNHLPGSG